MYKCDSTETRKLGEISKITMGQSPNSSNYNEIGNGVAFFQGRTDFGNRYPDVRMYTTEIKKSARIFDILLSVRAPVGDINIANCNCCIGRGLAAISSEINNYIYYALLSNKKLFDIYNNSGTIFGAINKSELSNLEIQYSSNELVKKYNIVFQDIDEQIKLLSDEIDKLKALKDLYLKKFFD